MNIFLNVSLQKKSRLTTREEDRIDLALEIKKREQDLEFKREEYYQRYGLEKGEWFRILVAGVSVIVLLIVIYNVTTHS